MIRQVVRTTVEILGTATGLTALARRRARDTIAVLAYHNVVAPGDARRGDASLHLPLPDFIRQIERITRTHDVVDLEDAALARHGNRPRAVITFDDAYRGAVILALPELLRRGLPAVVFVSPALFGTPSTWWDEMAEARLLSEAARSDALTALAGRADAIRRQAFAHAAIPALPRSYGIASLEEVRAHCTDRIRIGSHSWSHEYLPALDDAELTDNLARTMKWLDAYDGPASRWLALPYGGSSPSIGRAALALGHTGVLRIDGGLWVDDSRPAEVPRINVPTGMSVKGLELRTSGLKA